MGPTGWMSPWLLQMGSCSSCDGSQHPSHQRPILSPCSGSCLGVHVLFLWVLEGGEDVHDPRREEPASLYCPGVPCRRRALTGR